MADYKVTNTELISIANAIRIKGGTQSQLEFPTGFVSAVQAIPSGGSSDLPSGYKRLDFLSSRNGQRLNDFPYIDTGILSGVNIQIEIDYAQNRHEDAGVICGCRSNGSGTSKRFFPAALVTGTDANYFSMRIVLGSEQDSYNLSAIGAHKITFNNSDHQVIIDGITVKTYDTVDLSNFTPSNNNILLFASGDDSDYTYFTPNGGVSFPAPCDIFYCKITDTLNNIALREFVPCQRESDSELGMFDKQNNVFYSNSSGGLNNFFGGKYV